MRKILFAILAVFILTLFVYGIKLRVLDKQFNIVSPVPSFLSVLNNNQVSTLDLWRPVVESLFAPTAPQVTAKAVLVYDLTANKTLYSKEPLTKLPMASLTKIMTATIAIENKKADDRYLVKAEDLVGEESMGLTEGEVLTLNELLYGLMLSSGNDAAEVLARNYLPAGKAGPAGRKEFISAMNNKAMALGLENTNFTNPSGLEGDGDQYTTTQDLLVMTTYALQNEEFAEVVKTFRHDIPHTFEHKAFYLENSTNLISSYPGVKGVKIGYTPEAGHCIVTYLEYKGHELIGIILGSDNRRQEMKELLDYSLKSQGITPPPHE
ncbi:MAG: D-alanyl-D-alanine carboxypeptidase [Candidatus Levyibacteriota bacterium]